ncbi:hypothetical protein [Actinomadura alba]|uniref:Gram-positive cocci surface proteins LPxTG domain-containing protein n=1 Tax=Actinomadura alba TaxID=406431 RepID=A0ABR7LIT5_9ACTN|nr:hypothetical protein [Actinomadura alba]MBC6464338.1 hypothetical protein [Actinomadura alba]
MRLVSRAVTTAGATVLGITVMGGMAQADTATRDPSLLSGLTDTVTGTTELVDGLVSTVADPGAPARDSRPKSTRPPGLGVDARVETPAAGPLRASAGASVRVSAQSGLSARAAADVCLGTASCGNGGTPPIPPRPPTEPGSPPVPSPPPAPSAPPAAPPVAAGEAGALPTATGTVTGSLPFTGGSIDTLAGVAGALVLTGAAALAATRRRARDGS